MEKKKVNTQSIPALVDLYDVHTKLFINAIEGISEEDANNRLNTKANHPSWIAGSLVQQRFEMAKLLGSELQSEYEDLFKDYQGIKEGVKYPALSAYKADWEKITPIAKDVLLNIQDEKLNAIAPVEMGEPTNYYEMIYFSIHREAYCIGQLGLFRRLLGYDAMKYE